MKKILLTIWILIFFVLYGNSQNIGIMLGGGFAKMNYTTKDDAINKFWEDSIESVFMYRCGVNFENILIEKKFYLQVGLFASMKGYQSLDKSNAVKMHSLEIPLELKYKFILDYDQNYNFYLSAGPYVGGSYSGDIWINDESREITFGKTKDYDLVAFDYGVNFGAGFGLSHFQIGYNFGLGLANNIPEPENDDERKNISQTCFVAFYFTKR